MAQCRQFKFAHRSLQTKQQAIVWRARVIRTLRVDRARVDQRTQPEQVMPVAPVRSKPRGFQAENRSHEALADLFYKLRNPGRSLVPLADTPRSASMIATSLKP